MNNNAIYNAAVAGAGGGLHHRWITSTNSTDYTAIAGEVNLFALAVDAAIPADTISDGDVEVMQSICEGVMAGRYLYNQSQAQMTAIAQAAAALFTRLRTLLQPVPGSTVSNPVYIENYLAAAGNDIRTAIRTAWLANTAAGTTFVYPRGTFTFVGAALTQADGFRNNTIHMMYGFEVTRDMAGVASGQQIFFLRSDTGAGHADNMQFFGGKFSLLNCLTSYFGYAIGLVSASNCKAVDCEFYCTLTGAATTGRIRWGIGFFGGTLTDGGGRNNVIDRCTTTLSQIQLCGAGSDVDGITCTNIKSTANNDYVVSCVSSIGFNVRNVFIGNIEAHNIAGSGVVFAGTDGAGSGIGADVVENVTIDGVQVDGVKDPDLDFNIIAIAWVALGHVSQNVSISHVNTTLVSTELQSRSVMVVSQSDELTSENITISDCNLGIITTNDPLEPLYIGGLNMTRVAITNVNIRGLRGLRIQDADNVTLSNVNTLDGRVLILAESRAISDIAISNCNLRRTSGFSASLIFQSTTGKNVDRVHLSNVELFSTVAGLQTVLTGGTMDMIMSNVRNVAGSNPTAETITGIKRAVNCPGFFIVTTVSVVVPAVAAGAVGYVIVSMAGTRLADLTVNEAVVACPQAQLVATGAGGAFCNARVQATGAVECAFVGPLAGGAVNFSFARAAA